MTGRFLGRHAVAKNMVTATATTQGLRAFPGLEVLNPWNSPLREGLERACYLGGDQVGAFHRDQVVLARHVGGGHLGERFGQQLQGRSQLAGPVGDNQA